MSTGPTDSTTTPALRLGARHDGRETTFRIRSASASAVDLCLLDGDPMRVPGSSLGERRIRLVRSRDDDSVWEVTTTDGPGTRYGFRVHGDWAPDDGIRANPAKLLLDPYADAVDLPADPFFTARAELVDHAVGNPHRRDHRDSALVTPWSVVVAPSAPPASTRPGIPMSDTVVYELHVGHTTRRHPGVAEPDRGRFAGLATPAFIEHLLRLGVTTVELLPVHQFVSEPGLARRGALNAWGYNTLSFFAPHAAYCRPGNAEERAAEVADAVQRLHAAGLEVLLDVVFNHTAEGPLGGPTFHLRGLDNAAYYRLDPHDRNRYVDWTGCGNTVDSRSPEVMDLVIDSLRTWAERFDVDGYRFDLAAMLGRGETDFEATAPLLARIADDPLVGSLKLVAEPWDIGPDGYQLGDFSVPAARWSEWNDRYRNDVRSFWRPGGGDVRALGHALAGSSDAFRPSGRSPYHSVNFLTAHDGFTLRDLVSYDHKHNESNGEDNRDGSDHNVSWNGGIEGPTSNPEINELRLRRQSGLLATLLLSLGTPMLTAGDELSRTQRGNNNAYCRDDETVWLDWTPSTESRALTGLVGRLLEVRRRHRLLGGRAFLHGTGSPDRAADVHWLAEDGSDLTDEQWNHGGRKVLGAMLVSAAESEQPESWLLVWINSGPEPVEVTLPTHPAGGTWSVQIGTARVGEHAGAPAEPLRAGQRLRLADYGVLALAG